MLSENAADLKLKTRIEKFSKGWKTGLPETPCGIGSKLENTTKTRAFIKHSIKKYGIKSINDIGAGDLNWISHLDLSGIFYRAFDLIPRHPYVERFDLINQIPQKADLLLCIYVLNHMTIEQAHKAYNNLLKSESKYLIVTDYFSDYFNLNMKFIDSEVINENGRSITTLGIVDVSQAKT